MSNTRPAYHLTFRNMSNSVLEELVQSSTIHARNVVCDGHFQIINCAWIMQALNMTAWQTSTLLKVPVHQLSRGARDEPISTIRGGRPANNEAQNIIWPETGICAGATTK